MTSARDIQASDANDLVASSRYLVAARGLDEIVVAGADTNGILRGKRIGAERFVMDPTAGIPISDLIFALDVYGEVVLRPKDFEGWWPSGETTGYADVVLVPDLTTFRALPWTDRTGIVLGDFHQVDGGPVAASPQAVLQRVVDRAAGLGLGPRMAAELEFFILGRTVGEIDDLYEIEMAVPLSPGDILQKRKAIFMHQSQKDEALFPGPSDQREFWQRAEERNRNTAKLFDKLGLPEYEAIEGFVRWREI